MTDKQRAAKSLSCSLPNAIPISNPSHGRKPELLVATVLAAQCTDKRVNQVTPELFRRWPDSAASPKPPSPNSRKSSTPSGSITARRNTHRRRAARREGIQRRTPNTRRTSSNCPAWFARRPTWSCGADSASTRPCRGHARQAHLGAPRAHQAYRSRGHRKGSGQTVPAIRMGQGQPPDGLVRPPCL